MTNKVKLGEILSLRKGKKVEFSDVPLNHSTRFIQIDDLRNDNNLKFTTDDKAVLVDQQDVLIAWDGANAGTVGYHLSGAIGSTITALRLSLEFSDVILSDYLGLFLKSKSTFLRSRATGATIPHLSRDVLLSLQLPLMTIAEQQTIISKINLLNDLIKKRKKQLVELDNLVKSRYSEEVVA